MRIARRFADTSLDESKHFSDSVLAGSVTEPDRGYHLSRLTGDTSWAKGFEVGKGQSGQDALRHVMHIAAYSRAMSTEKVKPHGDFYHVVHPSMTTLVCSEALGNGDIEQDGLVWSKRFQEAWDETDIFDLLVKFDTEDGGVMRGPNEGTMNAASYSKEQQEMLLHVGEELYNHFDELTKIFDYGARRLADNHAMPPCFCCAALGSRLVC